LYELCKRYMDEIDEDIHRWWSNYY
jgi:hypothetical protein